MVLVVFARHSTDTHASGGVASWPATCIAKSLHCSLMEWKGLDTLRAGGRLTTGGLGDLKDLKDHNDKTERTIRRLVWSESACGLMTAEGASARGGGHRHHRNSVEQLYRGLLDRQTDSVFFRRDRV